MRQIALLSVVASLAGCMTATGHLYPVQGPLAAQTPPPIQTLALTGAPALGGQITQGDIKATLLDGQACQGHWTMVNQNDPSANAMSAQWDSLYGGGFFTANVLGNQSFARSTVACSRGRSLQLEWIAISKGIATDNNGNLFKLTFGDVVLPQH